MNILAKALVLVTALGYAGMARAQPAQWELGIGLGVLDIPFYPGSSQSKTYTLPIPHLLYLSDRLEIDNGLEATVFKNRDIRLNLSADLGVPVNSRDSTARAGMPDLDLVIQLGPSLEITLTGGRYQPSHVRLEFPLRAAIATDFSFADHVGWVFEPRVSYESRRPYKTGFAHLVSVGLRAASSDYNGYYYDVPATQVTAFRPPFEAGSGYSGAFVDYIANWRSDSFIYWALIRYQNLSATTFEDSPLVEQDDYYLLGAGITWIFASNL